ncbi:MAG TPA: lipoyl(octanoyl) transferase LipB, partial [Acidimicrobiales bacterium]
MTLRVRWLGRVRYRDAWAVQRALHAGGAAAAGPDDHLLLLEHPHVYTLGVRADLRHVLVPPAEVGAELVRADRGGDVTYHGPGQLVGYPILSLPGKHSATRTGMADTVAYVRSVEQLVIDVLADLGLPDAGRLDRYPGVWIDPDSDDPRKVCAIGVRLVRGRSMHGFALNVDPDMSYFGHIVPCGIPDKRVTSLAEEGLAVSMAEVVEAVAARAAERWGKGDVDLAIHAAPAAEPGAGLAPGLGTGGPAGPGGTGGGAPSPSPTDGVSVQLRSRMAKAGVTEGLQISARKPEWLRAQMKVGRDYRRLEHTIRDLGLVTVCE